MLWACRVLALAEGGMEPPPGIGVTTADIADTYSRLVGTTAPREKFDLLIRFGRRITDSRQRAHFVAVPVPRRDVVRGHVPEGAEIAPDFQRWSGVRLKALKDLAAGHSQSRPAREPSRTVYDRARDTLQYRDRLVAVTWPPSLRDSMRSRGKSLRLIV